MKMLNKLIPTKEDKKIVLRGLFEALTNTKNLSTATEIIFKINAEIYPLGYTLENREKICVLMPEATNKLLSSYYKRDFKSPSYQSLTEEIMHLVDLSFLPEN